MADNETVADIIAEMRRRSDEAYKGSFNYPECQENQIEYDEASEWADRLEAAHKRELSKNVSKNGADFGQLGDAAKLRDALEATNKFLESAIINGKVTAQDITDLRNIVSAALAAPPRNCDRFASAEGAHKRERGDCAKLREALVKCRDIALQWQADEAAGVAGTTDKPHARSAAEAVIDMEFEINAALAATEQKGANDGNE